VLVLLALACNDGSPTGGTVDPVTMQVNVLVAGTPINTVVVEVTAADFTALVFNLTVENGVATGTIRIPPGSQRTIHVTAFDIQGNVTHEGQTTIDVRPGVNPPVSIPMVPRSGQVPITITFGQYAVVVSPAEATIDAANSTDLQLGVVVSASNGGMVTNPAISWATTNPAMATVSATGLVTGRLDGVINIVAVYEGVAGLSLIHLTGFGGSPVCAQWAWTPTNVDPCDPALPAPFGTLSLAESGVYNYNTSTGVLSTPNSVSSMPSSVVIPQTGGPSIRVLSVAGFSVAAAATLRVNGTLPLLVLVDGTASVAGEIDVSAAGKIPGPGGDDIATCFGSSGSDGIVGVVRGSGAGGGGYGTRGGNGGGAEGPGGLGGSEAGSVQITPLRGGCPGGAGGAVQGAMSEPGAGGGAIQIVARLSLSVTGSIRSAGGGGLTGASPGAGGSGGGAGGAILLESDAITIAGTASLCANGGSGGEGRDVTGTPGGNGQMGTCSESTPATTANLVAGGEGGAGGVGDLLPGNGTSGVPIFDGGGGGGGGSVGRVRVRGVTTRVIDAGATVTPPAAP